MQKIDGKMISVMLTTEQLEVLEHICKRHNLKRAQALRNCLDVGLEVYSDFEKAGVPQFIEVARKAKLAVRNYLQLRLA